MTHKKIIRNESGITRQIVNGDIADGQSLDVQPNFWLELINDHEMHDLIESGDLVVNDGEVDLSPAAGVLHVQGRLNDAHEPIQFSAPIGVNAPEAIALNGASYGFAFDIGNELYTFSHLHHPIGSEDVTIQLHMAVDNAIADRWIQFEFTFLTTTGIGDKLMNTYDDVVQTIQKEVPTTPFLIFDLKTVLPAEYFSNGEDNIFLKVKRITATGKTAPTNRPVIVRMDKIYKQEKTA